MISPTQQLLAPGSQLAHRYTLEVPLGQGGMGTVYRGRDTLLDRPVAVKVLHPTGLGADSQARLLREAQMAARLNHPGIVSIYDAGQDGGRHFIVMELVEGQSIHQQPPQTLPDILHVARQVCAALEHAHANGIIHRDLKPENVLLAQDGTAKLTDFGLARSAASRLTSEGTLVGTVFYLAPEQALGRSVDGRSDLYSLGVLLYELLAGRLPFTADDPLAVISQHLLAPVVPPSTYNPALPPAVEALVLRLLSKEPEHRPASAAETAQALEALRLNLTPGGSSAIAPIDRLARGRLVAREVEMTEVRALWQRAASGAGQTLLISGEPGIGKTRFMRELATYAEVTGGRTFVGECYAEGGPPYAPLAQIILAAFASAPETSPGLGLPDLVLADLVSLAPALATRFPGLAPNAHLDPQAEQQRLFESVAALTEALAANGPLLWVVDDAHWSDGGSLLLLRYLARRGRRMRLLLAITYREVELDETRGLNDLLLDLNRERLAVRIKLARLTRDQVHELLAQLFNEDVTDDFVDGIYRETEGNPFFVEEVCKALIEEGRLYRENGRWLRPDMSELAVPQSVRLAIQGRVSKLPANAQDVLRVAAILGREFDFATLQQASEQTEDALVDALETAERAQLIGEVRRAGRETYAFAHALIPATVRESVSGVRRHRLHRRVAAAVEKVRPDDFEVLAYHYAEAGDEDQARRYYVRAGDRSRRLYASQDALRLYSEALALTTDEHPERMDLLTARAGVYDLLGMRPEQRADIDTLLALAIRRQDLARQCDALMALADYFHATDFVGAEAPAQHAVDLARQIGDPVREGHALRRLGTAVWVRRDLQRSRELLEAAVARFREAGMAAETAACLHTLSLAVRDMGEYDAALAAAEEAVTLARQAGDRREEAHSLRRLATTRIFRQQHDAALEHSQRALDLHREIGDRTGEVLDLNLVATTRLWLRQLDEARRAWQEQLGISQAINSGHGVTVSLLNLFWMGIWQSNDYEAGLAFLDGYAARPDAYLDTLTSAHLRYEMAFALAELGQYARAIEGAEAARALVAPHLEGFRLADILAFMAPCHAELGQFEQANALMEAAVAIVEDDPAPRNRVHVLIQRGRLALAVARQTALAPAERATLLTAGLQHVQRALEALTGGGTEWFSLTAYACLAASELCLAQDQPDAALDHASEAIRILQVTPLGTRSEDYWFAYSEALRAGGRQAEADDALRRAFEQMMAVAGKFTDPALRASWLEAVAVHRRITQAAAEAGLRPDEAAAGM